MVRLSGAVIFLKAWAYNGNQHRLISKLTYFVIWTVFYNNLSTLQQATPKKKGRPKAKPVISEDEETEDEEEVGNLS